MTEGAQPGSAPLAAVRKMAASRERGEADTSSESAPLHFLRRWPRLGASVLLQYTMATGVVCAVTLVMGPLAALVGYRAIALIYLLAVVLLALFVGRGPTLAAATLSALAWDFFFVPPLYYLRITNFQDMMLFGMYFVVALVLGQLTARIRAQEKTERQGQERATALYLLTRELSEASGLEQTLQKAVQRMEETFKAQAAVLLPDAAGQLSQPFSTGSFQINEAEAHAADLAFEGGQPTGKFTGQIRSVDTHFAPLTTGGGTVGVLALRFHQRFPPTIHQGELLEACARQIALVLDRQRLREASEKSKLLAESERLSKTLLNSISHEIRTPLAVIQSATGNLAACPETGLSPSQQAMVAEIQEATERLNRLVGNVLDITRLESGSVKPKRDLCEVSDLVHMAVKETRRELARHQVTVEVSPGLPLVRMDFVLMQQALANLLSNAAFHTPPGTTVRLGARVEAGILFLVVADGGPGIPTESLPRIFDKFYRGPAAPTGGTGLGLSLVKGFVEAQGGQVQAENRPDGGAMFTLRLPVQR